MKKYYDDVIAKFKKLKENNPDTGVIPLFAELVRAEKLTQGQIKRYLRTLCKRNHDYFDESSLLKWLYKISIKDI